MKDEEKKKQENMNYLYFQYLQEKLDELLEDGDKERKKKEEINNCLIV